MKTPEKGTVTLRCDRPGCGNWEHVQAKHLPNLLASGPWRCTRCRVNQGLLVVPEVPSWR